MRFASVSGWMKSVAALVIAFGASAAFSPANATAPACYSYNGTGYCQYNGRVTAAYINSNGEILLFFDSPMPASAPTSVGISGVTVYSSAIYRMTDNPDYGKALYSTLLAAQARGATIAAQLWGVTGGYMKIDRIWIYE